MDINTITEVVRRPSEQPGSDWREGDAWLAGGTWLFPDQQPDLRRLIDLVPLGTDWLVGVGTASSIHETAPPTEHVSDAWATLRDDGIYEIAVGTIEFGDDTSRTHVQIAATVLGTTPSRIHLVQSDTDRTGFDTGAFAAPACSSRATLYRRRRPPCAMPSCASPQTTPASTRRSARWTTTA